MADRFFPNNMPGYADEGAPPPPAAAAAAAIPSTYSSSLHHLLSLPYPDLADRFLHAALHLKQKVNSSTTVSLVRHLMR